MLRVTNMKQWKKLIEKKTRARVRKIAQITLSNLFGLF
jgi:hypothetical protein